jgi:transposase-like protein
VQDIFIACVDGLKGFPEAIESVYPQTAVNRPGICRHFLASNLRPHRRCHESKTISRRI